MTQAKTYLDGMDKLHAAHSKLTFICTGLMQNSCQWQDKDIEGLSWLLGDLDELLDSSYKDFQAYNEAQRKQIEEV